MSELHTYDEQIINKPELCVLCKNILKNECEKKYGLCDRCLKQMSAGAKAMTGFGLIKNMMKEPEE